MDAAGTRAVCTLSRTDIFANYRVLTTGAARVLLEYDDCNLDLAGEFQQECLAAQNPLSFSYVVLDKKRVGVYVKRQGSCPYSLISSGDRKLCLLWFLIVHDILGHRKILFWDEPDANLEPRYMRKVLLLFVLQRRGVQMFLTTTNYLFVRYLVAHGENDKALYFSLTAVNPTPGVKYIVSPVFSELRQNWIEKGFCTDDGCGVSRRGRTGISGV